MERAAQQICQALFDELRTDDPQTPGCALVRCYKTHRLGTLDPELQAIARRALGDVQVNSATRCLVLIGSAGVDPAWNSRKDSRGHRVIPLASKDMVGRAPMIAQLFAQLGVPIEDVIAPSPEVVRELAGRSYGVFHVENAVGSWAIPAQDDFVVRYGVKSVVGFGGALANGDLFSVIVFARVHVGSRVAERFRSLAVDVKGNFFRFSETDVFDRWGVP